MMCGGRDVTRTGRRGVGRKRAHFRGAKGDFGWRVTPFTCPGVRRGVGRKRAHFHGAKGHNGLVSGPNGGQPSLSYEFWPVFDMIIVVAELMVVLRSMAS